MPIACIQSRNIPSPSSLVLPRIHPFQPLILLNSSRAAVLHKLHHVSVIPVSKLEPLSNSPSSQKSRTLLLSHFKFSHYLRLLIKLAHDSLLRSSIEMYVFYVVRFMFMFFSRAWWAVVGTTPGAAVISTFFYIYTY